MRTDTVGNLAAPHFWIKIQVVNGTLGRWACTDRSCCRAYYSLDQQNALTPHVFEFRRDLHVFEDRIGECSGSSREDGAGGQILPGTEVVSSGHEHRGLRCDRYWSRHDGRN